MKCECNKMLITCISNVRNSLWLIRNASVSLHFIMFFSVCKDLDLHNNYFPKKSLYILVSLNKHLNKYENDFQKNVPQSRSRSGAKRKRSKCLKSSTFIVFFDFLSTILAPYLCRHIYFYCLYNSTV